MGCDKVVHGFCVLGDTCQCYPVIDLVYDDRDRVWKDPEKVEVSACRDLVPYQREPQAFDNGPSYDSLADDEIEYPTFSQFGG